VPLDESHQSTIETTIPVQLIDISQLGLQLSSKFALEAGDRAQLRTTISSQSVRIPIEVRRVTVEANPQRGGARYRAGAVFGPIEVEHRVFLKQVLGTEPA
jgi:hypothetical protein